MPRLRPRRPALRVALLLTLASAAAAAQPPLAVQVTNFPNPQPVAGQVEVPEPVPHSRLVSTAEVLVPPGVGRGSGQLIAASAVEAAGFTRAVLSLAVEVRGTLLRPGEVGAVLLPDEGAIVAAYEDDGTLPFALETRARLTPGPGFRFYSGQLEVRLGFPRYRVLLYNSTDRTVAARLYTYLVQ